MTSTIHIKNILKESGIRATTQRVELVRVLSSLRSPVTLKDILKKWKDGSVHEVTLYRMLTMFRDKGLVRQIDFRDTVPYFEIVDHTHDHHHIICTNCRKISDFVGCGVGAVEKKALLQSKDFVKITGHSFEFFGLCKNCI